MAISVVPRVPAGGLPAAATGLCENAGPDPAAPVAPEMNWTEAGTILALILLNGFFAGSELALVSARKARLKVRADAGHAGARTALRLLEDPTRLLSSLQIGITLVGILTGVYSGAVFAEDLAHVLERVPSLQPYAQEVAFGVVVVAITYLSLILGELVPKRIALVHAERIAELVSRPMLWVAWMAAPLVWVLRTSTEAFTRLIPVKSATEASVTEDEVRALIATGTKEGVFHRREKEMIDSVLRLADRSVESVMIPRGDIIWLDATAPLEEMWSEARTSGHARFLVAEGELEQLMGVVTLADLGDALRAGRLDPEQHVRAPLHVPPTVSLLRLLELFRESPVHLAVVTGEYGEILGLVTPMDILKAIAGELPNSGSRERAEAIQREDGSWLIDGQLNIHEAEQLLGRNDLEEGEAYHTMAGFVLWRLGRLPVAGESLVWRDLRIEVVDMDGTRIDKILVTPRVPTPSG
jgi:putative hemolysin